MATVTAIPAGTYTVDPAHSNVGFEIKHLGIATVRGAFTTFEGSVEIRGTALKLGGSVEVASVSTNNADRDGHLQSPDFFDSAQFPQILFSATGELAGDGVTVNGEITIKGMSKPITLTGSAAAAGDEDPWGKSARRLRGGGHH